MKTETTIKTVYSSNQEILQAIEKLHLPEGYECDMTYGNGAFWKGWNKPKYCYDITPLFEGVEKADSRMLPLPSEHLNNCVFDPPFLTYVKGGRNHAGGAHIMSNRFGGYYTYEELEEHYRYTLSEVYRVLKKGGKLVFKCQDIIHNHKLHPTHLAVCNWADYEGFRLLDLFVLPVKHKMPMPTRGVQKHARIHHSYFLVFIKPEKEKPGRLTKLF